MFKPKECKTQVAVLDICHFEFQNGRKFKMADKKYDL